jgi:5-methylthioadenosine/S-adenosylhomocysteine deaminase
MARKSCRRYSRAGGYSSSLRWRAPDAHSSKNTVGTLTPEKEADIVVLRADLLNVRPINNAPDAVVNLMNPSNVETVFIARTVMKWRGSLAGIDVSRVLRLEQEARDAVLRRAGFKVSLPG